MEFNSSLDIVTTLMHMKACFPVYVVCTTHCCGMILDGPHSCHLLVPTDLCVNYEGSDGQRSHPCMVDGLLAIPLLYHLPYLWAF